MSKELDTTNLRKQLEILGVESIGFITKILAENDKQVTGNLIKSLDFRIIEETNNLFLQILAAPYFKFVDEGRRPGKIPPIKPIQKWSERKGIKFKNMNSKQTAFVIARSIGKKGIKPLNIMNKLVKDVLKNKTELLKKGAVEDITKFIDQVLIQPSKKNTK